MRVCNELKGMLGPVRGPRMAANQAAQSTPKSGSADEAEGRYGNHHRPKYAGVVEIEGRFR